MRGALRWPRGHSGTILRSDTIHKCFAELPKAIRKDTVSGHIENWSQIRKYQRWPQEKQRRVAL